MTKWRRRGNDWIPLRVQRAPRSFREQVRDEVYTIVAWGILAGVVVLVVVAYQCGG